MAFWPRVVLRPGESGPKNHTLFRKSWLLAMPLKAARPTKHDCLEDVWFLAVVPHASNKYLAKDRFRGCCEHFGIFGCLYTIDSKTPESIQVPARLKRPTRRTASSSSFSILDDVQWDRPLPPSHRPGARAVELWSPAYEACAGPGRRGVDFDFEVTR